MPMARRPDRRRRARGRRRWPTSLRRSPRRKGVEAPQQGEAGDAAKAIAASLLARRAQGDPARQRGAPASRRPARCCSSPPGSASRPAPASATSARRRTASAPSWSARCPAPGGLHAGQMLGATGDAPLKAMRAAQRRAGARRGERRCRGRGAATSAEMVVVLTPFKDAGADVADVMLPIAPFTETSGTFVNAEGRVQGFHGVVKPLGDTRPAWKVLRVLGNLLGLEGFDVRVAGRGARRGARRASTRCAAPPEQRPAQSTADAGKGSGDGVRRARAHRRRADLRDRHAGAPRAVAAAHGRRASAGRAACRATLWQRLGLAPATRCASRRAAPRPCCLRRSTRPWPRPRCASPAGHRATAALGAMFGPITVEKAAAATSTSAGDRAATAALGSGTA